jgi:hypothetical protein
MGYIVILKARRGHLFSMNPELDGKKNQAKTEESTDARAKALAYALVNRPSPPF